MALASGSPERSGQDLGSWIGFWAQFAVLGVFVVLGAFFAADGESPGDYRCGLVLSLAAIAVAFLRLRRHLDGGTDDWRSFLFVDDMSHLWVVVPLFTVIGLIGLFIAHAWEEGGLHIAGIALFIVSGLFVFFNIKRVFDRLDGSR